MLVFNVAVLCCTFIFHREGSESEALLVYDPRYRYYSYNNFAGRGSYGRYYYDQQSISYNSPTKSAKKSSHKQKSKSPPAIDISFEPLGALKIDSLTHGQIEINPDKIEDLLLNLASGTLSMIPDFYQYIPGIPFFNGDEPATTSFENQSSEESSHPKKHRNRNSDQDDSEENNDEKDHSDESKTENDDDDNAAEEHDASDSDKSKEKPDSSEEKNNSKEETDEKSKDSSKNSKEASSKSETEAPIEGLPTEEGTEIPIEGLSTLEETEVAIDGLATKDEGTEIPIEGLPAQEGYVDTFVKYYSYAKPIAKAASLFVPGIGQYRGVMLGVEMADLAYNVANMYKNGDGYLSMGYFLGKEAFKRLGRRNEPFLGAQVPHTTKSETDFENFLDNVTNTQYPSLDEEKEQEIKKAVANIVYKYCHDQEQYQNETERTKFIDLMISCVKFIAFHEIIPETSEKPNVQTDEHSST